MESIYLSPYSWTKREGYHFEIRAWCLDHENNPHLVRLVKAPLMCHVELPPLLGGRPVVWDQELSKQFYDFLCFILKEDRPIECEYKLAQDLYYFQGAFKGQYMKLTFRNLNSMNHCTRILAKEVNFNTRNAKYGTMKVLVHELDIDPIRKILTEQNCNFGGWFNIRGTHPVLKDEDYDDEPEELFEKDAMGNLKRYEITEIYTHISTIPYENEWIVDWRTLSMAPEEEVEGWVTHPRVVSFDLECYSNNHRAFPEKWDIECTTFMVSVDFQIDGDPSTREGHGVVLGRIAEIPQDRVANVQVTEVTSELNLIYELARLINHYDPEVITGYNILDFDIPWIDAKLKLNMKQWPQIGRILSEPTIMKSWTWESGGYGFNDINLLEAEGRIVIDAYPAVRRGHKLLRYNLDTVAKHFLGKEKCDVSPIEMFLTYERSVEADNKYGKALAQCEILEEEAHDFHYMIKTRINHVNKVLTEVTTNMATPEVYQEWKDLPKKEKSESKSDEDIDEIPGVNRDYIFGEEEESPMMEYTTDHDSYNDPSKGPIYDRFGKINWCSNRLWEKFKQIASDSLNLQCLPYKYSSLTKSILGEMCAAAFIMARVMIYCFWDSRLVIELFGKLNIWIGANEMASVVGVPIVDLFTRGQQVRCLSQLYDCAAKQGIILSKRAAPDIYFNGGFVFNVVPGIFDGVAVIDFNSLYPSIMIAYNLCYTTLLKPEHFNQLPKEDVFTIKVPRPDAKDGNNYDFEQPNTEEGEEPVVSVGKTIGQALAKNHMDKENLYFRFVKPHIRKGLIPTIVNNLITERKKVRAKQARFKKGSLDWAVLEERQNALKVSANSMFGFTGAGKMGKRPIIEVAMSITAVGRELINFVNNYVETTYGADVVYGDSVTRDTPILVRNHNIFYYTSIDHLPIMGYQIHSLGKEYFTPSPGLEVWTDEGFSTVKEIIRHKTNKRIYKIITNSGIVKITEDHSLLTHEGDMISPKDLKIGMRLLTTFFPNDELLPVKYRGKEVDSAISFYYSQNENKDNYVYEIEDLGTTEDYVYDIETSNHHFAAGVGRLVVHNTDSSMIDLHIEEKKDYIAAGKALAEDVSKQFPPPLRLELEKVMKMILFCKKKYAGYTYTEDGTYLLDDKTGRPVLFIRGIILARRDNARWLRIIYEEILRMALDGASLITAMKYLIENIKKLLNGEVDHNDLIVVRSIGAHYKNGTYFMKLFADNLARIGKPARPGDRIGYLVYEAETEEEKQYLGNHMMLPETYLESKGTPDERKIDYLYYLEKQFMNSLDQLFSAGFSTSLKKYNSIVYRPSKRCKFTSLSTPVKMMVRMIHNDQSIDKIIKSMEEIDSGNIPILSENIVPKRKIRIVRKQISESYN